MQILEPYFSQPSTTQFCVSAAQASAFAKNVAQDFNPIHDVDSRRFCVPGDLLFALALQQYGVYQRMQFQFLDLVNADIALNYPMLEHSGTAIDLEVTDANDKPVLGIHCSGEVTMDTGRATQMLTNYVAFSGHNFPHILVPLMREHKVMINPQRPLVIYQSMAIELEKLDFADLSIALTDTSLSVAGKRGTALLNFSVNADGEVIGHGTKQLVLSGLRAFEEHAVEAMCDQYQASKPTQTVA